MTPRWWAALRARARALFRARAFESELDEELRFHLECAEQRNRERGMTPGEAARAARAAFGSFGAVERTKDEVRRETGVQVVADAIRDLRHAARAVRRSPGFASASVLTLALGVGVNVAIFSLAYGILLEPLPIPSPDRVVTVQDVHRSGRALPVSPPNFVDYRGLTAVFEDLAAVSVARATLTGVEPPRRLEVRAVTANFFDLIGVSPVLGRGLVAGDDRPGSERVALVSDALWRSTFGAAPETVGGSIVLDGTAYTVVGVVDGHLGIPLQRGVDVWLPLVLDESTLLHRGRHTLEVIGRLADGVAVPAADGAVSTMAARLAEAYPDTNAGYGARVLPWHTAAFGAAQGPLLLLLGAAGLVLLIACANVANLSVARGVSRQQEVSIRAALGAGRHRLARHLVAESLVIGALSAAAALVVASGGLALLDRLVVIPLPRLSEVGIDGSGLAFALVLALGAGVVSGLAPLVRHLKPGPAALGAARGTRGGQSPRRVRSALVVAEFALAVTLLIGAGLFVRSLGRLTATDLGVRTEDLHVFGVALPANRYPDPDASRLAISAVLERLRAHGGVETATATSHAPLSRTQLRSSFVLEGVEDGDGEDRGASLRLVTPGYFSALDIPIVQGRALTDADRWDAPRVVVINETARARYWGARDPLGTRVSYERDADGGRVWSEVVGVAADVRHMGAGQEPVAEFYESHLQALGLWAWTGRSMSFVVRTSLRSEDVAGLARESLAGVDPNLPVVSAGTLDQLAAAALDQPRFQTSLFVVFGALAVVLSGVGVFGVVAFDVGRRRREIGIRMALGAGRGTIVRRVVGEGLALASIGTALGLIGALGLSRLVSHLLFGVTPTDPVTYVAVPLTLSLVAVAACLVPALRAAGIDPVRSLRDA